MVGYEFARKNTALLALRHAKFRYIGGSQSGKISHFL